MIKNLNEFNYLITSTQSSTVIADMVAMRAKNKSKLRLETLERDSIFIMLFFKRLSSSLLRNNVETEICVSVFIADE